MKKMKRKNNSTSEKEHGNGTKLFETPTLTPEVGNDITNKKKSLWKI